MTFLVVHSSKKAQFKAVKELIFKYTKVNISSKQKLLELNHPDIHLIYRSKQDKELKNISIEKIKELQQALRFKPFRLKYQLAIIFNAELLSLPAQNALLKDLEEHSKHTIFILITDNENNLLPTIVSRSQKIYPSGRTKIKISDTKSKNISSNSSISNLASLDTYSDIFTQVQLIIKDLKPKEQYQGISTLLKELAEYYENDLINLLIQSDLSQEEYQELKAITRKIALINQARDQLLANTNKRLCLENLLIALNN